MNLDEAIEYCNKIAVNNERKAKKFRRPDPNKKGSGRMHFQCIKTANDYKQLAEWLKDYKRLLNCLERKSNSNININDMVSKQEVINIVTFECGKWIGLSKEINKQIQNLSSAEPDIVMCKDCKHYGCILHSGTQFECGDCFSHEESDYTFAVKPDDYCSRAERRTNG